MTRPHPLGQPAEPGQPAIDLRRHLEPAALASELLRIDILVGTFALAAVAIVVARLLLPAFDTGLHMRLSITRVIASMAVLIAYELVIRRFIGRRVQREQSVPAAFWYVNAFVEVSVATLILLGTHSAFRSPIHMLSAPAFGIYFALIILSTLRLDRKQSIFTGCAAAAQYVAVAAYVLATTRHDIPDEPLLESFFYYYLMASTLLIAGLGAGFVAAEIQRRTLRVLAEREKRNQIVSLFGQFISPELVEEIVQKGASLGGKRQYVCIMFLDIRGFTTFAERRDPAEVVDYIDTLFRAMAEIVQRHHGMIHQFQGDGFLAFFGAPLSRGNDCRNALNAALELLRRVDDEVASGRIPDTSIGIGLHAGDVVAGTIGSAIHREYAVTGDAVNLASRIEGLNKRFESRLLVSAQVLEDASVEGREGVALADLGEVDIRGRSGRVHLYKMA